MEGRESASFVCEHGRRDVSPDDEMPSLPALSRTPSCHRRRAEHARHNSQPDLRLHHDDLFPSLAQDANDASSAPPRASLRLQLRSCVRAKPPPPRAIASRPSGLDDRNGLAWCLVRGTLGCAVGASVGCPCDSSPPPVIRGANRRRSAAHTVVVPCARPRLGLRPASAECSGD